MMAMPLLPPAFPIVQHFKTSFFAQRTQPPRIGQKANYSNGSVLMSRDDDHIKKRRGLAGGSNLYDSNDQDNNGDKKENNKETMTTTGLMKTATEILL